MLLSNQKTSLLVPTQLPAYIREDPNYANFVLFLQAYYEWLEQQDNITDVSKNILTYKDIDSLEAANVAVNGTSNVVEQFIDYFQNEFLSYFPTDILANQTEVIKLARQLYQSKGTPSSYKFLFRILYNTDVDFFNTKDAVLKASAGTWYVPKSLLVGSVISSDISYWSNLNGRRIFGATSKSMAVIENTVITPNQQIEVFISNIEREFESGEVVYIVDNNNQNILDGNGSPLVGQIVGQLTQISINPNYRGLYYAAGNPVIVYGGLLSQSSVGATASVANVTAGSIQSINTVNGGYGYTISNTLIGITNGGGAVANVYSVNSAPSVVGTVSFLPEDSLLYITPGSGPTIGNTTYSFFSNNSIANANTTLANTFNFASFLTYPIASLSIQSPGSGITVQPTISAESTYPTTSSTVNDLSFMGILAPLQIINGGVGYVANDTIKIIGGSGYGAYANVITVNSTGSITNVAYVYPVSDTPHHFPLGGMGYRTNLLPTINIASANASATGAVLSLPGILGTGASFYSTTDRAGAVSSITVNYVGNDYVATPNVSLTVQDLLVTGLVPATIPASGTVIYQGNSLAGASYSSTVYSTTVYQGFTNPLNTIYTMRVYNYSSQPNPYSTIKISGSTNSFNLSSIAANVINYGDGTARATATFLKGIITGVGQYLDSSGQLSSYDVIQSEQYNNYTYEITLEKEIAKYKNTLLNLLHPAGTQVLGRYALKSNNNYELSVSDALFTGLPLSYYTGTTDSSVSLSGTFAQPSTNVINFNNLFGAELDTFIFANSVIRITSTYGDEITANVAYIAPGPAADLLALTGSEDLLAETGSEDFMLENDGTYITVHDNIWMAFANVAYASANAGSNKINITSLTGFFNIVNNGNYTNPANPLLDIIRIGDTVKVNNMTFAVSNINYGNTTLFLNATLPYGANNALLSVSRNYTTSNVQIFGPVGLQYLPEFITEDGRTIITEDGNILVLG